MNDGETLALLQDIVFWGHRLASHIADTDEARFTNDPILLDAVCWCFVCIGEAAGRVRQLRPDIARRYANFELAKAYAMRNRLAHGYDSLDQGLVWLAASESVPELVEEARRVIASLSSDGHSRER